MSVLFGEKVMKEKQKNVLLALAAIIGSMALYKLTGSFLDGIITNEYVCDFTAQLAFAVYATAAVFLIRRTDVYRAEKNCLKSGWTSAGLAFVLILFYSVFGIATLLLSTATPLEFILFVLQVVLIGYTEELLFRGVMQRALHRYFGETNLKTVLCALVLSGLCFGIAHLGNIARIGAAAAVTQAVSTVCSGIYWGAVYFRTGKHPWFIMFLHFAYDWAGFMMSGRLVGGTASDAVGMVKDQNVGGVLFFAALYLVATLIILRPKKLEPLLEK